MRDEELAHLLCDAYGRSKPLAWIDGDDDNPKHAYQPRVIERWVKVAREVRRELEADKREQTAATILAAFGHGDDPSLCVGLPLDDTDIKAVHYAVALADALRAELAKPATAPSDRVETLEAALRVAHKHAGCGDEPGSSPAVCGICAALAGGGK